MMKRVFGLVLVCSMLLAGVRSAGAQALSSPNSHAGVAVKLSTLGIGVDLAVPAGERVNVRGEVNFFDFDHDFNRDGIVLNAKLKLRSVNALLDWFPTGGGFHVSPGLMIHNGNEVDATAAVPGGDTFSLGDDTLRSNPSNPVHGGATVTFQHVAPMVLFGWGNIVPRGNRRVSVPFELGVVFSKAPKGVLSLAGSACDTSGTFCRDVATEPRLQADVAQEQANLNSDISVLKVIPVLSIGVSFKF